jgi:hypothetical protein
MEGRMGSLEQSVHSLTEGQQQLMARITEIFEMLSTKGKNRREEGENSQGKHREVDGENSHAGERPPLFDLRHLKLEFPRFNGEED